MAEPIHTPSIVQRLVAEFLGTFLLVLGGVGTAIVAGQYVGVLGIALAFGLTVLVGVYAWGPVSGGHFNPAVTLGVAAAGRFAWKDVPGYLAAQLVGGAAATSVIVLVGLGGPDGWLANAQAGGFASNGFGDRSPAGFDLGAVIGTEVLLTGIFVLIILGATHASRGTAFAGIAIGLTLALIHLVSIPIDSTSVNPARSLAAAIYGGGDALAQLWVFLVFPIVGGLLAGWLHRAVFERKQGLRLDTEPFDAELRAADQ